jgi:hypothetical protein
MRKQKMIFLNIVVLARAISYNIGSKYKVADVIYQNNYHANKDNNIRKDSQ